MATVYGIGVGPGHIDLLTIRAQKIILQCSVIAYICDAEGTSLAKNVVQELLVTQILLPIQVPMQYHREQARRAYARAASLLREHLTTHAHVGILCLGDPTLYASYRYLRDHLGQDIDHQIIPGISAHQYLATQHACPLASLRENIAICSGTTELSRILRALHEFETVVIYKPERILADLTQFIKAQNWRKTIYYGAHLGSQRQVLRVWPDESIDQPSYMSVIIIQSDPT